jgi:hypothetical protein
VHRDVKPGNILLNGDRVVLTDFGIAQSTHDTTSSEAMIGSLDYMAPERVNGQAATPASDVWSLGVTLCTALRGESPFQRSDTQATLAAVLTYEPTAIPQAPRLWRVLSMLLTKDPRRRLNASAASAMLAAIAGVPRAPAETGEPLGEPATARVIERTSEPRNGHANGHPRGNGHPNGRPSGPVLDPLQDSTTGSRARRARAKLATRARRRLGILLAVLVLIVGAGIWMVVRPVDGVAGTATATGAKTAAPVPPGFTEHRGDGFSLVTPKGWFKDAADHDIIWLSDKLSPRITVAQIEWWDDDSPGGAFKVLTDLERTDFRTVDVIQRYERIKFTRISAPPGTTIAEMEIRYHIDEDGGFDIHERKRSYVTDSGRTYILTVAAQDLNRPAAERLWRAEQEDLNAILAGFRITS